MTELPTVIETKTRWIDTAEAAALLRPVLKRTFPGVKFSVRIQRYAGGSTIHVGWTDGPTDPQVSDAYLGFQGNRFDGRDDLQYGADSWHCAQHGARPAATYGTGDERSGPVQSRCCAAAELVHFASSYVSTQRTLSPAFRATLEAAVTAETGQPYHADTYLADAQMWMSQRLHQIGWVTAR